MIYRMDTSTDVGHSDIARRQHVVIERFAFTVRKTDEKRTMATHPRE